MSHTSIDRLHIIAPGLLPHTWCSHCYVPASSIHSFGWACTITPVATFTPFGNVFLLKMTTGFNLVPSAKQARTTVKRVFSWPVVLMRMVLAPEEFTVRFGGKSNVMGVSSMLPI